VWHAPIVLSGDVQKNIECQILEDEKRDARDGKVLNFEHGIAAGAVHPPLDDPLAKCIRHARVFPVTDPPLLIPSSESGFHH